MGTTTVSLVWDKIEKKYLISQSCTYGVEKPLINAQSIMHNAQWGLRADALLISQSCTYWCRKARLRRNVETWNRWNH